MLADPGFASELALRILTRIYDNLETADENRETSFILRIQELVDSDRQPRVILISKKPEPLSEKYVFAFCFAKANGKPHKFDRKLWRVHKVGVLNP